MIKTLITIVTALVVATSLPLPSTAPDRAPLIQPNLVANVKRYGASGSAATTFGSIAAGSHTLTLARPIDFENGTGIFVPNAGTMSTLPTPKAPAVSIGGGRSGTSTYGYRIVALDGDGGAPASSPVAVITTGPPTLGGLGANGGGGEPALYKATWLALNVTGEPGANGGYAVYRTEVPAGSGLATGFIGIDLYTNAPFLDYGQRVHTPPPGVPASPPSAALGDSFVTTILHGGGTTVLTLSAAASTDVANDLVYHDDTRAFQAALAANPSLLYVPPGSYGISSPLNFHTTNGLFYGNGPSSLIRYQGNTAATLNLGASGITLEHLALDGQSTSYQLVGVSANHALTGITIRDTVGRSSGFYGVNVANPNPPSIAYTDIAINGNVYSDCEYAYSTYGNVDGIQIRGNRLFFTDYNHSGRGISLHNLSSTQGYTFAQHFLISSNTLRAGNHSAGIVIQGGGSGVIRDNVLLISGGIYAFWGMGTSSLLDASGGYSFTSNHCTALWPGTGVAVNLTDLVHVNIADNHLRGFGYAFQVGGYGGPAFAAVRGNAVTITQNRLSAIAIAPVLGPLPLGVLYADNPVSPH